WLHAFLLQSFFQMLAVYPAARSYFAEMKFKPKPRFHHGFLIEPGAIRGRCLVGSLFPQAPIATASGYHLLDDVLGDGFALLALPGTSPRLLEHVIANRTPSLQLRFIAVLDKEDSIATAEPLIPARDVRGDLAKLLAGSPSGLYLIRPDR